MTQSTRYRAKAQALREDSANISDSRIRDEMLIIATQYDQLAQEVEQSEEAR